jgi:methyl-accepting chemotaxis protein
MTFSNLKIGTRLAGGFTTMLALMALTTGAGILHLKNVQQAAKQMTDATHRITSAQDWMRGVDTNAVRTFAFVKNGDAAVRDTLARQMDAQSASLTELQNKMESLLESADEKQLFARIAEKRAAYRVVRSELFKMKKEAQEGGDAEVQQLVDAKLVPAMTAYTDSIGVLLAHEKTLFEQSHAAVDATYDAARNLMVVLGLAALALGAAFAWMLSVGITRPLRRAVDLARTVASGDLTSRIDIVSRDETGQLMAALKEMKACSRPSPKCATAARPSRPRRSRSRAATSTCRRAPSSRPVRSKKPRRPWRN